MVVDFLVQILISFFTWVISFLPNFNGLPGGLTDSFSFVQTYWNKAELIFPISTLFQILALMIGIEIAIFSWRLWWFTYGKTPGKAT